MKSHLATLALCVQASLASPFMSEDMALVNHHADELADGQPLTVLRPVAESPWPEVIICQRLEIPWQVVAEVFADYEKAPQFIKNVDEVRVREVSPSVKEVSYKVKLPVVASVHYITKNTDHPTPSGYAASWVLLNSPIASSGSGSFTVLPSNGGTFIVYRNRVVPANPIVAALRTPAIRQVEKTVSALVGEAYRRSRFKVPSHRP